MAREELAAARAREPEDVLQALTGRGFPPERRFKGLTCAAWAQLLTAGFLVGAILRPRFARR